MFPFIGIIYRILKTICSIFQASIDIKLIIIQLSEVAPFHAIDSVNAEK